MDSVFPKPYDDDIQAVAEGVAIVIDGDTAPKAITSGQYLFIKNHSTLATGGYHATDDIASGGTVSSSNVAADADGVVNAAYSALNSNIITNEDLTSNLRFHEDLSSTQYSKCYKNKGTKIVVLSVYITVTANINANTPIITLLPAIKGDSGNFVVFDITNNVARNFYITSSTNLCSRHQLTAGCTYVGMLVYFGT